MLVTNVVLYMISFKNYFPLLIAFLFASQGFTQPNVFSGKKAEKIDYSKLSNWAAHPDKNDPSDSLPISISDDKMANDQVDVFFIHPTTLTDQKDSSWNADIYDVELNNKTDNSTILYQASAFNAVGRVFAPRYRQVHIRGFFTDSNVVKDYFELAYQDVASAFQYYLEHYNNGRPIIIASHSQGTWHAKRILKMFFDQKELQKKLVCAYIIGFPVEENYFKTIPVCSDSNQTGCFVSWRTFHSGYVPDFVKKENFKALVVNPLSWKTDGDYVSKEKNFGGVMYNFNKITKHVVDAKISGNILWSCKPDIFGKILLRNKNYHIGDINLFYMNIRENTKCRLNAYLAHYAQ